jgi:ubiquinol-cytochrome c reductase cytochrome c subunit
MRFLIPIVAMLACNAAAAAGNAEQGRTAFVKHGCYQCHGFAGQGGSNGKTLAPNPLPFEAFSVFVRNTNGAMPPYQKAILSDDDLADIYAYLRTVKAPDYKTLPLP